MTAKIIPPLIDNDDYTSWSLLICQFLLLLALILNLLLMCCMNVGMGRVWSLFFMLQLVSNFDNFSEVKIPANVSFFLKFLDKISNFKITEVEAF